MDCSSPLHWLPRHTAAPDAPQLQELPLATLYLTERCNSRCTSCSHWRTGRHDMSVDAARRLLPGLAALGTREVLVSGGEPLLHPHWAEIAQLLRAQGLRLWLLTAGLALAKHATAVAALFDSVTVSLDGATAQTYRAIRGVDGFDAVCAGIHAVAAVGRPAGLRVTVQRGNFRELPQLVELARELGAANISFLPADVSAKQAFGRSEDDAVADALALRAEDLPVLAHVLDRIEHEHAKEFACGFILESPAKLGRVLTHARAVRGLGPFPAVRCNAPEFSAVIESDGRVRPCFFIPGPPGPESNALIDELPQALNTPAMRRLRADIRAHRRPECERCVCAKWREPAPVQVRA